MGIPGSMVSADPLVWAAAADEDEDLDDVDQDDEELEEDEDEGDSDDDEDDEDEPSPTERTKGMSSSNPLIRDAERRAAGLNAGQISAAVIGDGRAAAEAADDSHPATLHELLAEFPGESSFVLDAIAANATMRAAKMAHLNGVAPQKPVKALKKKKSAPNALLADMERRRAAAAQE